MDKNDYVLAPRSWVDSLGTTVSIACAIQCSVFPLLIGVLPLLGLGFLLGDGVEKDICHDFNPYSGQQLQLGIPIPSSFLRFYFSHLRPGVDRPGHFWVDEPYEIPIVISGTLLLSAGHF